MKYIQDSTMVLLTNEEYLDLHTQQAYYFTVNKDVNQVKHDYFVAGYHSGGFYGVILGVCLVLLPVMINNTIKRIKGSKTKENETPTY